MIDVKNWIKKHFAGSWNKEFRTLEDMDRWLDGFWGKVCIRIGLVCGDYYSPIQLSCEITPENANLKYIKENHPVNLPDIVKNLVEHYGEKCIFGMTSGKLVGVEVTQEDYYWILDTGKYKKYCTCVGGLMVEKENRQYKIVDII